jgi:hypothetical protein
MVLLKVIHALKIYHNSKFHGSTLTGFASKSKFERPPFWNGCSYGIKSHGAEAIFNAMTSLPNFIKIYRLVQKLIGGHTDRKVSSLASIFPLGRKVG